MSQQNKLQNIRPTCHSLSCLCICGLQMCVDALILPMIKKGTGGQFVSIIPLWRSLAALGWNDSKTAVQLHAHSIRVPYLLTGGLAFHMFTETIEGSLWVLTNCMYKSDNKRSLKKCQIMIN